MTDPMERFRVVFFEESAEAIDAIEQNLLRMNDQSADEETINDIFRAAHSLKGGSATFGMSSLTEFTHVMETLLDKVRSAELALSQEIVDCLFSSLDVLRALVAHYQFEDEINEQNVQSVKTDLEALLGAGDKAPTATAATQAPAAPAKPRKWRIQFVPHEGIMMTGNDPIKYVEELEELGEIRVTIDTSRVPDFAELEPTNMHLHWDIELDADEPIAESDLTDLFMWVEDDADLTFTPLESSEPASESSAESVAEAANSASAPEPPALEQDLPSPSPAGAKSKVSADKGSGADKAAQQKRGSQSIRVQLEKIDSLINLLGELVITQSMLSIYGDTEKYPEFERMTEGLAQLERHTRELQEGVMAIRMLPIDFCFSRFPRIVRDLAKQTGKQLSVDIIGETTEVDKTVIEELTDPLVHLVRNSCDHGIEMPDDREAKGKPRTGTVTLRAFHQVGNIIIEISDDGAGLNTARIKEKAIENGVISVKDKLSEQEIHELIFAPGFSTADAVTDLSGRGVGMDVVKRNIQSLGGLIDVTSTKDEGSTFTIRLPLTLAILDGQLIRVGEETYIIPMLSVIESIRITRGDINQVGDKGVSFKWRGNFIPIIDLAEAFGCPGVDNSQRDKLLIVVVESDNKQCGILVNELTNHQQVVVKSLEANYAKVNDLSGATILGDGSVALIIDVGALISRVRMH